MDKSMKKTLKRRLLIPSLATFLAALVMVLCIFLPYASATPENAQKLEEYQEDVLLVKDPEMTAKDMKHLSMAEYANIFYKNRDWFVHPAAGVHLLVLVVLIGGFSLAAALFALGRKSFPAILFSCLAYGVFTQQNNDYMELHQISSGLYNWGIAHTLFPIASALVIACAIWMFIQKIIIKNKLSLPFGEKNKGGNVQ